MIVSKVQDSMRDMEFFADETLKLLRENQLSDANIKSRRECLKKLIINSAATLIFLTEAAQELEGFYYGQTITKHG